MKSTREMRMPARPQWRKKKGSNTTSPSEETSTQGLEAKYQQLKPLGEGGHRLGSAGYRRSDNIPVAIKHIPKGYVICQDITQNKMMLPLELTVMIEMATAAPGSVGKSAAHPGPGTSLLLH